MFVDGCWADPASSARIDQLDGVDLFIKLDSSPNDEKDGCLVHRLSPPDVQPLDPYVVAHQVLGDVLFLQTLGDAAPLVAAAAYMHRIFPALDGATRHMREKWVGEALCLRGILTRR